MKYRKILPIILLVTTFAFPFVFEKIATTMNIWDSRTITINQVTSVLIFCITILISNYCRDRIGDN